ncbi:metallophosphoesterase [Elizabethkingia meningoseptica]|uniref:metallophosphoesterase n=1 Tax=Elizabethkingia meningoseptica TaxID=238 RepID=UPI0023AE8025|nr:metallophosphoesterase [Elizabethkingia meningoseptica]MDE5432486.1 metallophosphoesterase [Elizabethkingia meningoseptica]MDE5439474.1 metallophosphoesterase [Elizabethkingia meningoseptica]MDE5493397.1 metallophosphoesterase [Elizabethkingia meningoseptica]MDE5510143.1 metallophosphoesterase [Elizabethkingia meningoseptica]MDE5517318.1 metallophosphoesterase [Elizabethkingia meningoseptica]
MNRKTFLKRLFQISVAGAFPVMYSWQIEPFWVEFVERKLPVKNLPGELIGKTLMQISDMHVGNHFDWNFLIKVFQEAKAFHPDFVVYTGDYVSWESEQQYTQLRKVMQYVVRGKLGTCGILGNHDYGKNWSERHIAANICDILESSGITMLNNAQQESHGLNLIGFEDFWSPNFNPLQVMKEYDPAKANLVLCHNPDVCDLDVWNGYQGWILSGHTHGGQCRIPGVITPVLPVRNKRYTSGEIDLQDGRMLYINRAIGHSRQIRFMVRPEITLFTLTQF